MISFKEGNIYESEPYCIDLFGNIFRNNGCATFNGSDILFSPGIGKTSECDDYECRFYG